MADHGVLLRVAQKSLEVRQSGDVLHLTKAVGHLVLQQGRRIVERCMYQAQAEESAKIN